MVVLCMRLESRRGSCVTRENGFTKDSKYLSSPRSMGRRGVCVCVCVGVSVCEERITM